MTMNSERPAAGSSQRNRFAVVIVVDDEADRLDRTISCARLLTENVFVLCTNRSESVAQVVAEEGLGDSLTVYDGSDRSAARNSLIEAIESSERIDWILWMKAGERFDEATLEEFLAFTETEIDRNSLYVMMLRRFARSDERRHDFDEETIDARLMPLRKGLRFSGRTRESLFSSAMDLMIPLHAAPGRLLCPSRYLDDERQKNRGKRNLDRVERIRAENVPIQDELLALQASAHADLGLHVEAQKDYLKLIEETDKPDVRLEAYYELWESMMISPVSDEALTKALLAGLEHYPVDFQLLTLMAAHLQRQGKFDLAIRSYEIAVRHGQVSLDVWHRRHIRENAVVGWALTCRLLGKNYEAIKILENHLEEIEDRTEYVRHLFDLYINEFQETRAHDLAATIWGGEELDRMRDVLTGACRAAAGAWEAALFPLESAYGKGCRDVLCLRWYSLALLSAERFGDAVPVLQAWGGASPGNFEPRMYLHALRQPERFHEIVRQMQDEQRKKMGLSDETDPVREIIDASGTFSSGGIQLASFTPKDVEIQPGENGAFELVVHPE